MKLHAAIITATLQWFEEEGLWMLQQIQVWKPEIAEESWCKCCDIKHPPQKKAPLLMENIVPAKRFN